MVPLRLRFAHGWHELAKWRYRKSHKWYYMSAQTPGEPLLFIQFHSESPKGQNLPHVSCFDESYADGPARESIEIKMYSFWNE